MPLAYLDHNILINASTSTEDYKTRVRNLKTDRDVQIVLSTWHWVEMAKDQNRERGLDLADFADSLNPLWLRERRRIEGEEVSQELFKFMKNPSQSTSAVTTLAQVIAESAETSAKRASKFQRSRPFVLFLQTAEGQNPLLNAYQANYAAQRFLRDARHRADHQHGLSRPMRRKIDRAIIKGLLPLRTPQGEPISRQVYRSFLKTANIKMLKTLAIETALFNDALELDRALSENEFRDRQHAMSIPYVDYFVTDDDRLAKTIRRTADDLNFDTAAVISKSEFDKRFM
jgi:hypothetical protein